MEILEGLVEAIIFKSDDSGYIVAKITANKELVTIVGIMPLIKEGQQIEVKGDWINHKQFGRQFNVAEYKEVLPTSAREIEKYLSTGIIHGIGPVTAKKIVKAFGVETLDILDNDIERLREVEGIGEKKFNIIYESYLESRELKDIIMFFQNHGVTINQCLKIYKKFGPDSIDIVSNNPYVLNDEISGIGFLTSDRIAKSLGIEPQSDFRVQSGIRYVLNNFSGLGNTYMPKDKLIEQCQKVLMVDKELIEVNIYNSVLEGKVKVEKINDIEAVYALPYYFCELGVTNKIITLSIEKFQTINSDVLFEISSFENKHNIKFADSQKDAILGAFENGIEIITGGPGTGKTTIIKCIIEIYENNGMKVLLAAPTGRAAKRMTESTGREAKTIHRLLEMGVSEDENSFFGRGEGEPLEGDVIIIDEASMIDIMLMNSLLKAIKLGTRVIIVGDVDQLPSVGPGNVLRDLINSNFIKVVRLNEIFRQGKESMIILNAHRINNGELPYLNKKDGDFFFDNRENNESILQTILDLVNRRIPMFNSKWNKVKDIQILSPTRKGILGIENLNNELQAILNPPDKYKKERKFKDFIFRVGDKVMQTKNNYSLKWNRIGGYGDNEGVGIFNGDMGFIESIDEENNTITVIFDDERRIVYDNVYVEELELAYAITIHKSQGSEFKVVIIPTFMGSAFLMNRNILYTGITRAKELVVVVGSQKALKYMVDNTNSMERYSSLKERILDIVSDDKISE
ncbi:ATP-dependent RecD-like DNA helicase [Clostridium sp.]|uniref:SF1B family DNA helicase RecD2 n=1 Tax=Clostridium sp. TaxID=1506 RepID=UPI0025C4B496|nr:ATP-dependent RecD-like DNA helicase [Clostridium sp.]MCI9070383.1 ATP-dependent RecD-like DNA helicase [Clostridium sp.]